MNQIGYKSIYLDVVDSTNNYTANLVKTGAIAHGTVIMADEQTNGRGQRGTNWQTEPGQNLIFSLYVEFDGLPIGKQEVIHHWIALSITHSLRKLGVNTKIKWPNDIIANNGKIAGVLIENAIANGMVKHAVIGIGLNVNQTQFDALKATSVQLETGRFVHVREYAFMLISALNDGWKLVVNKDFETLKNTYLAEMWGRNESVQFLRNEQLETGIILGTDEVGLLNVQTKNGMETFDLKEIKFILD